jgi:shikimate 5-dehydrogenase
MKEITLKIPDSKLKFFLELVKQLGFETKSEDLEFPSMSKEEIVKQALKAETEIEKGLTMSHEQAYLEFKKWK